jgi:hypothetical protein
MLAQSLTTFPQAAAFYGVVFVILLGAGIGWFVGRND